MTDVMREYSPRIIKRILRDKIDNLSDISILNDLCRMLLGKTATTAGGMFCYPAYNDPAGDYLLDMYKTKYGEE